MVNRNITKEDLTKLEDNLGTMIAKGFNENTEQHRQIFKVLDKHSERFEKIDGRFDNVNARLDIIEQDVKEVKEEGTKQYEIEDLKSRIDLVEKRVGIIS